MDFVVFILNAISCFFSGAKIWGLFQLHIQFY